MAIARRECQSASGASTTTYELQAVHGLLHFLIRDVNAVDMGDVVVEPLVEIAAPGEVWQKGWGRL